MCEFARRNLCRIHLPYGDEAARDVPTESHAERIGAREDDAARLIERKHHTPLALIGHLSGILQCERRFARARRT